MKRVDSLMIFCKYNSPDTYASCNSLREVRRQLFLELRATRSGIRNEILASHKLILSWSAR